LPRQIAELLAARGHDATTVVEQGWQGMPDNALWSCVQREQRLLITADKGFADLRRYPPGTHCGVVLLRSREEGRRAYLELALRALEELKLDELAGAVVVVSSRSVRIRRPSRK
jgi:predicted nuclease of predicted toxin-antitoxin system